uniref:Uncharacterized protein n=1 Tax=Eutreptiella gymnastica TaxID=73025 RepID=A0A7S1IB55_9EUGL
MCDASPEGRQRETDAWEWRPPGRSTDPDDADVPVGESLRDVEARMLAFLDTLTIPRAEWGPAPTVMVFTHHAAICCALRGILEASPLTIGPKGDPPNTSITELVYNAASQGRKGGWLVRTVFDSAHLEPLRLLEDARPPDRQSRVPMSADRGASMRSRSAGPPGGVRTRDGRL